MADLLDPRWFPLIPIRRSRRSFLSSMPDRASLDRLEHLTQNFQIWRASDSLCLARAVLLCNSETSPPIQRLFSGIIGSYGQIETPPCALLFVINPSAEPDKRDDVPPSMNAWCAAGYVGQAMVLEATRLGLATCWVTGSFKPKIAQTLHNLKPGEKIIGASPLGYPRPKKNVTEKLLDLLTGSKNRLPMSKIARGYESWPQWAQQAVASARLAPSARAHQPWRFAWTNQGLTVSYETHESVNKPNNTDRENGLRLDCGIAMLHVELSSRNSGIKGRWAFLDSPGVARFSLARPSHLARV